MFSFPFSFLKGAECGDGFHHSMLICYAVYAITTAIIEVYTVLQIEKRINDKHVLSFNRWHIVELFMGQIARFDTFLDTCFFVLLVQCGLDYFYIPVGIFIVLMHAYPFFQLFNLLWVNDDLQHTQKYMERNC